MNTLEARVKKLESRQFLTTEQKLRAMSDEELEVFLQSALAHLSDEDFEEICREHPDLRPIYEERRNAPGVSYRQTGTPKTG